MEGSGSTAMSSAPDRQYTPLVCCCVVLRVRAAKQRFDEDEAFKVRAREAVTRLQVRGKGLGPHSSLLTGWWAAHLSVSRSCEAHS